MAEKLSSDEKQKRLAAELRANLRKRKQQQRTRASEEISQDDEGKKN